MEVDGLGAISTSSDQNMARCLDFGHSTEGACDER